MAEKELLNHLSANDLNAWARRSRSALSTASGRGSVVTGRETGKVGELARGDETREPPSE